MSSDDGEGVPSAQASVSLWPVFQEGGAELEYVGEQDAVAFESADTTNPMNDDDHDDDRDDEEHKDGPLPSPPLFHVLRASIAALRAIVTMSLAPFSVASAAYVTCLRTLIHAVDNVLTYPTTDKFRLLPLSNAKFMAKMGGGGGDGGNGGHGADMLDSASLLLQHMGWMLVEDDEGGSVGCGFLLLTDECRDEGTLRYAKTLLEYEISWVHETNASPCPLVPPSSSISASASASTSASASVAISANVSNSESASPMDSLLYQPLSELKSKAFKRVGPPRDAPSTTKLTPDQMAARVTQRLEGGGHNYTTSNQDAGGGAAAAAAAAASVGTMTMVVRAGNIMNLAHRAALRSQLTEVRRAQHNKWVRGAQSRKRIYTMADLAGMEEADLKARAVFGGSGSGKGTDVVAPGSPHECLKLGQEMLRLSNAFRAREGKRPLQWHQKLHDVGLVHSKNMALKTVPFGHDGAKARFAACPFRQAAENVAWSQGIPAVASCHVDGWIHSVQHKRDERQGVFSIHILKKKRTAHSLVACILCAVCACCICGIIGLLGMAQPGHRKNLLANHNWCAIAVFKNSEGAYYSTQLFGLG